MKFILSFLFLIISTVVFSQIRHSIYYINPVLGINVQSDQLEELAIAKPIKLLTSGIFGFEIGLHKLPLKLRYQHMIYAKLRVNHDRKILGDYNIRHYWVSDEIGLFYSLNKYTFGLTHYWKHRENSVSHLITGVYVRKGLNISVSYPVEWIDIELRTQLQYKPGFAALFGSANYSLSFVYNFNYQKKIEHQSKFMQLNLLTGARFFLFNVKLLGNELFNKPFGFAPQLGLEFLFKKYNLSFNVETDRWLSFNGGSELRDIKGLVYNNFIGIKYHQQLKNKRHIRYGFGGSFTEDGEYQFPNLPPKHRNKDGELLGLSNYQVKGFAVSISYEILPNIDIELKTILPTAGEYLFDNITRNSVGIIYRLNPFNKKQ